MPSEITGEQNRKDVFFEMGDYLSQIYSECGIFL